MCILFTEVHNYTNLNTKLISYSSYNDVTGSDNGVTGSDCQSLYWFAVFESILKKTPRDLTLVSFNSVVLNIA